MVFDIAVSCVISFAVLGAVARQISDHRYFNYQLEGLRAIRALRVTMEKAMFTLTLYPYALCLGLRNTEAALDAVSRLRVGVVAGVRRLART
jgi:hypothetical protein